MSTTIFKATPRKVREWTIDAITSGCVPFIKGSPGIGKSAIMRSISNEFSLQMIDHRLSTSAPEDLSGLPDFDRSGSDVGRPATAVFRPFGDLFPIEGTPIPKGKDGWLLFLDEFNSALKEVQAASYKLALDRMTGQYKLHESVAIVLAGNLASDKAIVNNLSTAMQSRLVHIIMIVSFKEWWEDVAIVENYDERIKGYLAWKGEKSLMNFDPDHDDETFPCPRTWEFMNRMVKGKTFREITEPDPQQPGKNRTRHEMDGKIGLYAGTVGQGEAASFVQYCKVTQDLLTIKDVLADPSGCKVHNSAEMKWGQITHLVDKVDDKNFADLCTYINRYDLPFRVLFFRTVMMTHPQLKQHPALIKSAIELAKWLYD
jgi:hypothetical protein